MQYKIKANKSLGQNFLQDENIIYKIINLVNIKKNDVVLEIGPGLGALTRYLLTHSNNVNVIELDSNIINTLILNCKKYGTPYIYNQDFLKFDIATLENNNRSSQKIKLIGNLPYNISTPILFKVIDDSTKIIDAHFMLQKEVVERIVSLPNSKSYGRLSVIIQYHFNCDMILTISPKVFYPEPKVESAILRLRPIVHKFFLKDYNYFEKIVKQSFSHRRKTLYNNLKEILKDKNINFNELPININFRAENLKVIDFVNLTNFLT